MNPYTIRIMQFALDIEFARQFGQNEGAPLVAAALKAIAELTAKEFEIHKKEAVKAIIATPTVRP